MMRKAWSNMEEVSYCLFGFCLFVCLFFQDQSDAQSLKQRQIRQIAKVTRLKKSSILTQIGRFRTVTPVWIRQWLRSDAQSLK